jgi:hypothetical protein
VDAFAADADIPGAFLALGPHLQSQSTCFCHSSFLLLILILFQRVWITSFPPHRSVLARRVLVCLLLCPNISHPCRYPTVQRQYIGLFPSQNPPPSVVPPTQRGSAGGNIPLPTSVPPLPHLLPGVE